MKRNLLILISLFFLFSINTNVKASSINLPTNNQTYLIGFKEKKNFNIVKKFGGEIKKSYIYLPVIAAELTAKEAEDLSKNVEVAYVEEDGKVHSTSQTTPWGISRVKAPDIHESSVFGTGIKVAILDSGIAYNHEDLSVISGISFVDGTADYFDDYGHGTHVAGIIAASNNSLGVLGVSPGVSLYGVKVLDSNGNGNYSDVIEGIEWSITNQMKIINLSFSGVNASQTLQMAVDKAYNSGILLVASAGNQGYDRKGNITYPAAYDSVLSVGAVNELNARAEFSSVGRSLDLMAPGVNIESTVPFGYGFDSGTSMAAPHVTGIAALLWQTKPELTNIQVRDSLLNSAINLGDPFYYGKGLVDGIRAINYDYISNNPTKKVKVSN